MKLNTIIVASVGWVLTAAVAVVPNPVKPGTEASVDATATRWLDHDQYAQVVSL